MLRFLLYTALALNCSALAATATDRYGGWLLEQPRSSVRTLSFKQSVQLNNKIETLELGFICDRRKGSKSVGVILIPFDGTFQSDQDVIPVLIQKNADQYDPSDLKGAGGVRFSLLAAAYSHAALGEKVVSNVTKLQYCGVAFGRNNQPLSYKLIQNFPFVPFQIRVRSLQQIAKDRNFEVRDIICHDIALL